MTPQPNNSRTGTAAATVLAFLLFYLPSMLTLLSRDSEPRDMMGLNMIMATCYAGIFCVNYFLLVPRLIFGKDSKLKFFAINLLLIVCLCALAPLWFESHGGLPRPRHLQQVEQSAIENVMAYMRFAIRDGIMMILSIALAYALCLSKAREEMRRRMLELEAERRNAELLNLKAQLNPHFLFNSLNNIYALIAIDPDKAQQSLHELSGMLRFMIYDSESKAVPLTKEIQFIRDYSRLMSLRLNPSVKLNCELPELHDNSLRIAPLLTLTIVENAFKHVGISGGTGFIDIRISVADGRLSCIVRNSCRSEGDGCLEKEASGVGLQNIEKQLNLLYPGSYRLDIAKGAGDFTAELEIHLSALS